MIETLRRLYHRLGCGLFGHAPQESVKALEVATLCRYCGVLMINVTAIHRHVDVMFADAWRNIQRRKGERR